MTDPLVRISKAERMLEKATDIAVMMDLRSKAKAFEVLAIAQGLEEVAQRAKIFQLRAERKAGGWLSSNIVHGGSRRSQVATLTDLEISKSQSSRWQLIATVSDAKFNMWIDDRIFKGHEITAGGLREYARILQGKPTMSHVTGRYLLVPSTNGCALQNFIIHCSGPIQRGHILSRAKVMGNKAARDYIDQDVNISPQCAGHNVGKLADSRTSRRIQLLQKVFEHGWSDVKAFYDGIPWKVPMPEFTLERMLEE